MVENKPSVIQSLRLIASKTLDRIEKQNIITPVQKIFGFPMDISIGRIQEAHLKKRQQEILQWQEAKKSLEKVFIDKGFDPVIVPTQVAYNVFRSCGLFSMKGILDQTGQITLPKYLFDLAFNFNSLEVDYTHSALQDFCSQKHHFCGFLSQAVNNDNDKEKEFFLKKLEYFKESSLEEFFSQEFVFDKKSFLENVLFYNKGIKNFREHLNSKNLTDLELIIKLFEDVDHFKIEFGLLPQEDSEILLSIYERFPSEALHIWSDWGAFDIVHQSGISIQQYGEERLVKYKDIVGVFVKKLKETRTEKAQERELCFQKLRDGSYQTPENMQQIVSFLRTGIIRLSEIAEIVGWQEARRIQDPIITLDLNWTYNAFKYPMTVILLQTGTLPNEDKALELLSNVSSSLFLGVQAN